MPKKMKRAQWRKTNFWGQKTSKTRSKMKKKSVQKKKPRKRRDGHFGSRGKGFAPHVGGDCLGKPPQAYERNDVTKGNVRHDCHLELCDTPLWPFGGVLQNRARGHQNQGQEASKSSLEAPKSTPKSLLGALGALLGASWRQLGKKGNPKFWCQLGRQNGGKNPENWC